MKLICDFSEFFGFCRMLLVLEDSEADAFDLMIMIIFSHESDSTIANVCLFVLPSVLKQNSSTA